MANAIKTTSEKTKDEWRALLEECAKEYRITNLSDYSGTEWLIEWND